MKTKHYIWMALALLVVDWAWGVAQVRGVVPLWSFAVLNFPFALPYIWMEGHWAGTRYVVAGQTVDELWSMGLFLFMVLGQAGVYWVAARQRLARPRVASRAS